MNQILDHVLGAARQLGASDVHLKPGLPPVFRIKGDLRTLRDTPPLTAEVIGTFAVNLMSDRQREIFDKHHDADLSYGTPDGVRYRVNVFKQRGQTGMVLRIIPPDVPGFDKLNLPPVISKLCEEERGLILVTGITGSGKSTTLAAMVDQINRTNASHIVTVEDPIEFMHKDRRSVVNQREIMEDPKRTREIRDAIANGRNPYGMMTFDQCLADLVGRRLITYETALSSSTTPDDFALQFRGVSKAGEVVTPGAPAAAAPSGAPRDPGDLPLELDRRR